MSSPADDPATPDSDLESKSGESSLAYRTRPSAEPGMPSGIPYIIGNEAAERFSFYGMKAILTIFMVEYLHWMGNSAPSTGAGMSNAEATEHFHTFTAAAYFFPVFGALLADVFLGKYRTILYLSIVYCIGHAALALMGTPPVSAGMWLFIGLLLISIGSGGIKPCVSANVGDQFGQSNQHLLTKVYQWFYFSINLGACFSSLLTPWVLQHYGPHWAFGIPGVLMAVATFLFWLGRKKFVHIPPGGMAFIRETFSWTGISAILKLMIIFSFIAVFWALFDQTGSSWVLQSKNLDRTFLGMTWLESQIQAVNPFFILMLIPLFQFLIYPAINRVFTLTPIRKISIGLFVMAGGFAIVSILQERIDSGLEPSLGWLFLAYIVLTASEVMVSITGLEFAYTQSPKSMKSIVMALFLLSVSLGNVFTASVNHFIQTPAVTGLVSDLTPDKLTPGATITDGEFTSTVLPVESADAKIRQLSIAGPDGATGGDDDIVISIDNEGLMQSMSNASKPIFEDAADKIEQSFFAGASESGDSLPSVAQISSLLEGLQDAHGNPIEYKLISRDRYQLVSTGADGIDGTKWDETLTGILQRPNDDEEQVAYSWLERRKIELLGQGDPEKIAAAKADIDQARGGGTEATFSRNYAIGGRVLLEGAAYFWFWTGCIFVAAVIFVPVGYFYKEKTYIQDDSEGVLHEKSLADESLSS
ncbi:POT family MFS transporter [Allorhodopirellula solitaria]|uniref:Dipeptide and tripeptide permease A n=1 Tax=Allorhodopirellula solitaria TaxID=2527987 RepID=A0A5C5YF90_9BACT|nr:POT family MFS transporter [Allorhodopirellula solitaria]TWT74386.1 Dipeptide and tripeptide permease A [Allorhodopirellula solitaria]